MLDTEVHFSPTKGLRPATFLGHEPSERPAVPECGCRNGILVWDSFWTVNRIADVAFDCFLNARKPSVFDAKERFVPRPHQRPSEVSKKQLGTSGSSPAKQRPDPRVLP